MHKIVFLFLFITNTLPSQSKLDNLIQSLGRIDNDSIKIETYIEIGIAYKRIDQAKAIDYFNKAESLALKTKSELLWAKSKFRQGTVHRSLHQFELANQKLDSAFFAFSKLNHKSGMAVVKTELAIILSAQNKHEEAVKQYLEALKLTKKTNNKNAEARIYNALGSLYRNQKQFNKALNNYEQALKIVKDLNFKPGISACLNNIAIVYKKMKLYDKSIAYSETALLLKKETGDKLGEARALSNIGELFSLKADYNSAENYFTKALILLKKTGNPQSIAVLKYKLATNAFRKNDYTKSIAIANDVIKDTLFSNDIKFSTDVYNLISEAYQKKGNFKQALTYARLQKKSSDSLYNKEIVSVSNTLEAKYQNEQKTKEIELLETKNDLQILKLNKQKNETNIIIAFSVIMLIFLVLLYNQYRIKQKANNKLSELDRLKSNFFANISHEFRTPLTLIKGPIELLEQNPKKQLSLANIKMIRRNTNRVLNMVNQLLDLSKIDEGKLKLHPTEGDVYKCLRTATSSFNSHAAQRHIDYRIQIPKTLFWASFDRDKLEKIVYNLLSNAFKFSENEAIISFKASYKNNDLKLEISDSGTGIPKEKLPFIFDRFYQVNGGSTKEKEGSGIGLSLSKDLIVLMDGTITAASEVNKGTVFKIHIPLQEIKTRQKQPVEQVLKFDEIAIKQKSFELKKPDTRNAPTILLVEDNNDMRQFIKDQLIKQYKVIEALHGEDGQKKALQFSPDLIITDLMMPKMDGIELCKQLKKDINTSHIPVIMLTAKAGIENKIEGLETGADDYLIKPFNANELLVRSRNLIKQRQKLRQLFADKKTKIHPKEVTVNSIDQKFLEQLLDLLEAKFSDSAFGITQMQKALAMSKTQLHRKLKALTNETPGELLRNFRLKRAAQLLLKKADTVTQIAYMVGFNNLSYFAKCFKEFYGVSPSSYSTSSK